MKQFAVLAGLAAGLAAANAHAPHHQHRHENMRRGADGVVTTTDITTEWTYVTVTAGQNQPPAAPSNPPVDKQAVQPQGNQVKAQAAGPSDPQAIQSSLIAEQNSKIAAQESINAHQESINNQPAAQTSAPAATTPVQAAPTTPTSTPAAPTSTGSTGGSTAGGDWHTAIGTYYGAQGGYGSCGHQLSDDGHTVALSSALMGSKQYCGQTITIKTDSGTYTATVADTCPGCTEDGGYGHIDIVQGWAHQIDPNIDVAGHVNLQWKFN